MLSLRKFPAGSLQKFWVHNVVLMRVPVVLMRVPSGFPLDPTKTNQILQLSRNHRECGSSVRMMGLCSSVTNGLMMLKSMAWMNNCETGCHCPVEPCARNCPSSVVYHGSTGRLHCSFLLCFCCLRPVQA